MASTRKVEDLKPASFPSDLDWSAGKESESLTKLREYAEGEAAKANSWYLSKRRWKRIQGQFLRGASIVLVAFAGLTPVASQLFQEDGKPLVAPGWSPAFLGVAALFILLDRFLGGTSSWLRYMGASQELGNLLRQFRFDWVNLKAALAGSAPNPDQTKAMIARCGTLVADVDRVVREETQVWVEEFRSVLKQVDEAVAKAEKRVRPLGAIDVEVSNGDQTDAGWTLRIDDGVEQPCSGKKASAPGLLAGIRKVSIIGTIGGASKTAEQMVKVPEGDIVPVSLTLA